MSERRHVDVLLPAAQSAPSGGGGTQETAEARQGQPGRSTWDQSHGPVPTDGWVHAVLQPGASGPEQTLRAGPTAAQRLARRNRLPDTEVNFLTCTLSSLSLSLALSRNFLFILGVSFPPALV